MKKILMGLAAFMLLLTASVAPARGPRGGGGGFRGGGGGGRAVGGDRIQNAPAARPGVTGAVGTGVGSGVVGSGAARTAAGTRVINGPAVDRTSVVRDGGFQSAARQAAAGDVTRGRYYQHNYNGRPYSYYPSPAGLGWYGFYAGSAFLWTTNYAGRWWYYDPGYSSWAYYTDDGWTHPQDPSDVPPELPPAGEATTGGFMSADGTREVRIEGANSTASIYARAPDGALTPLKTLGDGVAQAAWNVDRVQVTYKDGRSATFDMNGTPLATP